MGIESSIYSNVTLWKPTPFSLFPEPRLNEAEYCDPLSWEHVVKDTYAHPILFIYLIFCLLFPKQRIHTPIIICLTHVHTLQYRISQTLIELGFSLSLSDNVDMLIFTQMTWDYHSPYSHRLNQSSFGFTLNLGFWL